MSWGMLTKINHFPGILLSHNPLLDKNDINNFGPKDHLSKTIPILRSDAPIWKAFYGTCRCPEQMSQKKWKRIKEKMIVMSCTWKFWLSLNENQECQKKGDKKSHKHKSFPSCKESPFSLGNYAWDEKWPSFIIPSLIKNLSIVTPFEPDKFPSISRSRTTLHIGGKGKEKSSLELKRSNAWCWKANVKKWSSKGVELTPLKEYKWAKAKQQY